MQFLPPGYFSPRQTARPEINLARSGWEGKIRLHGTNCWAKHSVHHCPPLLHGLESSHLENLRPKAKIFGGTLPHFLLAVRDN